MGKGIDAPLHRMRTAAGGLNVIKEQDPGTEVTLHYLRHLINTGKVPVTPVGRKKLVDADAVMEYIAAGESTSVSKAVEQSGQIRRVPV